MSSFCIEMHGRILDSCNKLTDIIPYSKVIKHINYLYSCIAIIVIDDKAIDILISAFF